MSKQVDRRCFLKGYDEFEHLSWREFGETTDPAYRDVVQRLQSLLNRGPKAALPD
jgi:hypothetical protein